MLKLTENRVFLLRTLNDWSKCYPMLPKILLVPRTNTTLNNIIPKHIKTNNNDDYTSFLVLLVLTKIGGTYKQINKRFQQIKINHKKPSNFWNPFNFDCEYETFKKIVTRNRKKKKKRSGSLDEDKEEAKAVTRNSTSRSSKETAKLRAAQ